MKLSEIYHYIHAVLGLITTLLVIYLLIRRKDNDIDIYEGTTMLLLLAIGWGVHTNVHVNEETAYDRPVQSPQ
jgi:hypothetical protein